MAVGEAFVTRVELAARLGVTERTITNWVRRHEDFPSKVRGQNREFPLGRCIQWYLQRMIADAIASMAPPASLNAAEADSRKAIAEAELAEIKVAKARAEVVLVAKAVKDRRDDYGRIRAALLAKPGEYADQVLRLETVAQAMPVLRGMMDNVIAELQDVAGSGVDEDEEEPE
jgi:hypothetical protein